MNALTETQQKCLAIAPKITASFSIFGTCYVIRNVLCSKKKRKLVYHRILLCISGIDLIIGICMFLSTWPIPSDTANTFGAVGTTATCTAQGFFLQFAIMAPLYNAALSLYYLLMIRYNWTEERLRKLRLPVHGTILLFGLGTSIAGLFLTLYNPATLWCWQNQYPVGCIESSQNVDGLTTCQRGDNALSIYRWAFFYAPLWCAIAFATVAMILVFWKVHVLEIKSQRFRSTRYSLDGNCNAMVDTSTCGGSILLQRPGKRAKKVAQQAFCYVGAFYITWIWSTLTRILQSVMKKTYFGLVLMTAIFLPFQGFLNFLVYVRPQWERYRQQHPDWSMWNAMKRSLCNVCVGNLAREEEQEDDYNVAPTEAELRSILMTEAEDKEATDPNEAAMSTEMNRKEEAVNVSFSETAKSND